MTLRIGYVELPTRVNTEGAFGLMNKKYSHILLSVVAVLSLSTIAYKTNGYETAFLKQNKDAFIHSPENKLSKRDTRFLKKLENLRIVKVDEVQEEVKKNPEAIPDCVQKSTTQLEKLLMEVENPRQASLYMARLKFCVAEPSEHPISIQASCLRLAKEIKSRYPELDEELKSVFSVASKEAKSTFNFADSLTRRQ